MLSCLLVMAATAGAGVLTAALTMEAPRPPQPENAAVAPVKAPAVVQHMARSAPVRVEIPAIEVKADVIEVGVTDRSELEVPSLDKPMVAGWYRLGASPGERGNAVMVGHVDSEKVGAAVFFNLGKLKAGDDIYVSRKDGSVAMFKVDAVSLVLKTEFPAETVYGGTEAPALRLITCGGQLDKKNKNYLSNVVVFATLAV